MNRRHIRKPNSGQSRLNDWILSVRRTRAKLGMSAKGFQRSGIVPSSPDAVALLERARC